MAGANPKIAAIFGGGDFGMDYDKMNQQAYSSQSALQNAATMADANAYMADQEADYITESAKYKADAMGAQASAAQGAQMVGQIGGALSGVAGMFGGGGGAGGGGFNTGLNSVSQIGGGSMTNPFLTSTLSGY